MGAERWDIDGRGGRDQSWGPRDWHAKRIFRWLTGAGDDGSGFMVTRGVAPTAQRRGGFVWDDGHFHLVDDFNRVLVPALLIPAAIPFSEQRAQRKPDPHVLRVCVVAVGNEFGDRVEIKQGLAGGESVIIRGIENLTDGSRVKLKTGN